VFAPSQFDLLIVDDDADFRGTIARRFHRRGYRVQEVAGGDEAFAWLAKRQFDVVILDMVMPGMTGLEVLERLKAEQAECEALLLTGQGTIETAVQAMKLGAYDYLTKPFPLSELEVLIQKACERRQLSKENAQLKAVLKRAAPQWEMIGRSAPMQEVFRLIERAGPSEKPILILGESGTGKELVARALHQNSPRAEKPMITFNCAAIPESLLESELFGHVKGAFTGADRDKPGKLAAAEGGTLFIDEINSATPALQLKLLRVLQERAYEPVGSTKTRTADVRFVLAANEDLAALVRDGRFREDLYYRINVVHIAMPALRERPDDVPLLVSKFLGTDWQISAEALQTLEACHWPGNVRQLINVVERAKILAEERTIQIDDLPRELVQSAAASDGVHERAVDGDGDELASMQRAKVLEVLDREQGNKSRAAKALGINRRTLYRLLEKYGLAEEREPSR
jgi:DNA-binding NtrC family response regulator